MFRRSAVSTLEDAAPLKMLVTSLWLSPPCDRSVSASAACDMPPRGTSDNELLELLLEP